MTRMSPSQRSLFSVLTVAEGEHGFGGSMICKGPCTSDFATVKLIARESQVRFKRNFPAIFNFTATKMEFMVTKVQYNSESCEGTIKKN